MPRRWLSSPPFPASHFYEPSIITVPFLNRNSPFLFCMIDSHSIICIIPGSFMGPDHRPYSQKACVTHVFSLSVSRNVFIRYRSQNRALAKWTSGASLSSPRPNLKSSRLSISGDRPTTPTRTSLSPLFKPTRTLSQSNLMEPNISAALRFDAYAISPYTPHSSEVRPTRIPVLRTRTPRTSGHA